MIRILYIIPALDIGGAELLLKNLVLGMSKDEYCCEILTFKQSNSGLVKRFDESGIKVHCFSSKSSYSFCNLFRLWKFFSKNNFNLLHVHLAPAQLWVSILDFFSNCFKNTPILTTEHCSYNRRRRFPLLGLIEQKLYQSFNKVIVVSKDTELELHNWIPQLKDKTALIYNGIDLNSVTKKQSYGFNEQIKLISVCRLCFQKNPETLLQALAMLPSHFHLTLVGDGDLRNKLYDLASQLDIVDRVTFLHDIKFVGDLLHQYDFYIQASRYEGFSLSTVEALAAGLPVIVTNIAVHHEILADAAIYYPVENPPALVEKLFYLYSNPKEYLDLAKRGLERAQSFPLSRLIAEHEDFYRELLAESPSK